MYGNINNKYLRMLMLAHTSNDIFIVNKILVQMYKKYSTRYVN